MSCSYQARTCTEEMTVDVPAQVWETGGLRLVTVPIPPAPFEDDLEPGPRERGIGSQARSLREDVVHVSLPEGWEPVSLPPPVKARCAQAEVSTEAVQEGRTVTLTRTVRFHPDPGEAGDWPRLQETLRHFRDAGRTVLVLRPVSAIPAPRLGQAGD